MADGTLERAEATPVTAIKNRWAVAEFVHPDEPCYFMLETDVTTSDYKAVRRFRMFVVNRNDAFAYFWQDLGPGNPEIEPFQIISVWENTVGECIDLSHHLHQSTEKWNKMRSDMQKDSTLIADFFDQMEQAHKQMKKETHSGPTLLRQR